MIELSLTSLSAIIFTWAAVVALVLHGYLRFQGRKYPPGPVGDPLIGNLRSIPKHHTWYYYTELKKTYGDIVFVPVMVQKILLLNTYDVVNQLLSKRGVRYSGRYVTPLVKETTGSNPPLSPYGPRWKEERRMFHSYLGKETIKTFYRADVEKLARQYVFQSVEAKKNKSSSYMNTLLRTFLQTVYGLKIAPDNDILDVAIESFEIASVTLVPGRFWVNLVPGLAPARAWLRAIRSKIWSRDEHQKRWKGILGRLITEPYAMAKQNDKEGKESVSFLASMMHDDDSSLNDEQVMFTAGASFIAGSDTTSTAVLHFIRAMLLFPHIQKKAQEEIDRVIGRDRLPTVEDLGTLPLIEAIYKEVHRWQPVAALSLPHQLIAADVFNGYVIPEGSMVVQNTWAMTRDETVYVSPDEFMPERFLGDNPAMDPRLFVFGVGRRVCLGMSFGESIVLSTMMAMLATTDILKATDSNGKEISIDPSTTGQWVNSPVAFEFELRARSEAAVALLR